MDIQVDLHSIAMSKNDPKLTKLEKYDVEANIDEVENAEGLSVFKYGFTVLSNPKNVRLSIEGVARLTGDAVERDEILNKDDNDVPKILTMIYHELFPTFFLLSKNLNVACPPHQIGTMGSGQFEENQEAMSEENETVEAEAQIDESEPEIESESPQEIENPDMAQPTV